MSFRMFFKSRSPLRVAAVAAIALTFFVGGSGRRISAAPDAAPLRAQLARDLDAYLRERSVAEHLSSLSLCVSVRRDRPTINVTSGTMKFGGGSRVTPANLYQIGSNTKAFTAIAVLQLEAQHRLSIDAPIGAYLPQYPAYAKLTLRRLLNMTGGLESYDNLPSWEAEFAHHPSANVSADSLIRLVYPHIKFTPGTKYYYSNTGYLLAQLVVDARSRSKSYAAEIARIVSSAGLQETFYTSSVYPRSIARRVVAGYYANDDRGFGRFIGKDMSDYSLSWAQGAGAMVSTPRDLATWARVLYGSARLLPERQRRELTSMISIRTAKHLATPTSADPAGFGLGVAQRFDPTLGTFWFYQGETLGFRATHVYVPSSGLVVTLFANSRPVESESKLQALFGTIYQHIKAANYGS